MAEDPRTTFQFLYQKVSEKAGTMPRDKVFKEEFQKGLKIADALYTKYLSSTPEQRATSSRLFGSLHIPALKINKGIETPVLLEYPQWLAEMASKQVSEPPPLTPEQPAPLDIREPTVAAAVAAVTPAEPLSSVSTAEEALKKQKDVAEQEEVARKNLLTKQADEARVKAAAEEALRKQQEEERTRQEERRRQEQERLAKSYSKKISVK